MPVLEVLCSPGLVANGDKSKLESLVIAHCVEPSGQNFLRKNKAPATGQKFSHALFQEAIDALGAILHNPDWTVITPSKVNNDGKADSGSVSAGAPNSDVPDRGEPASLHLITTLFQLALQHRERALRGSGSWTWESQLFIDLLQSMHVNLDQPSPLASELCLQRITDLLDLSLKYHAVLDRRTLESICLKLCLFSKEAQHRTAGWIRLRKCLELDPSLVTKSFSSLDSSRSDEIPPVLELIVNSYTTETRTSEAAMEQPAAETVSTVAKGFANAREAPHFIELWSSQLFKEQGSSFLSGEKDCQSISHCWPNDTLRGFLGPTLLSSLTHSQVMQTMTALDGFLSQLPLTTTETPDVWASTIVTNCLLSALQDDKLSETLLGLATSLYSHCTKALLAAPALLLASELWQLLSLLLEKWPEMVHGEADKSDLCDLLLAVQKELDLADQRSGDVGSQSFQTAIAAWRFVTLLATLDPEGFGQADISPRTILHVYCGKALTTLSLPAVSPVPTPDLAPLNVDRKEGEELVKKRNPYQSDLLATLIARGRCLDLLEDASLLSLLQEVSGLAAIEYKDGEHQSLSVRANYAQDRHSWLRLWHLLLSTAAAGDSQKLCDALQRFHYEALVLDTIERSAKPEEASKRDISKKEFLIMSLDASRAHHFSGYERQHLADRSWDMFLTEQLNIGSRVTVMELLLRFLSPPRKAMNMLQDPVKSLYLLAAPIDRLSAQDFGRFIPLLKPLAGLLGRFVASQEATAASDYSSQLQESLQSSEKAQDSGWTPVAYLVMGIVFLDKIRSTSGLGRCETTSHMYLQYMTRALTIIDTKQGELDPRLSPLLDALAMLSSSPFALPSWIAVPYGQAGHSSGKRPLVADEHINVTSVFQDLESGLKLKLGDLKARGKSSNDSIVKSLMTVQKIQQQAHEAEESPNAIVAPDGLFDRCTFVEGAHQIMAIVKQFHFLDAAGKAASLRRLLLVQDLPRASPSLLMLLRAVLNGALPFEDRSEELRATLGQILNGLFLAISGSHELESPHLALRAANALVRDQAWAVTQWHVDSLLSTISIKASPSAPSSANEDPRCTFDSLCQLFQSILSAHRSRINGRYHLVVGALNGLMRCLFHPYAPDDSSVALEQAPWLYGTAAPATGNPLGEEHAKSFARLLTTICDPAPGVVKPPRGNKDIPRHERHLLTDGVKKARAIAGQHLQYVITEFCTLQLRGRLAPAVRAALNPGLYAIFGAMSVEIQRTANAALDEPGRAIFKAVYDDYMKFGRWEKG